MTVRFLRVVSFPPRAWRAFCEAERRAQLWKHQQALADTQAMVATASPGIRQVLSAKVAKLSAAIAWLSGSRNVGADGGTG